MSTVKIRSLTTTATTTASDDFLVIDGTTNSTRKLSAATPAFLTSVTVPTVATAAGVNLNLATGTAASDKVLIPGTLEATAADGLAASIGTLGGASVKKALWVGGIINVAGHTTFEGVTSTGATGTGNLVYDTSPSLTTPALGTPSALVGTNITGTAAGLTAGNVTTNANLTGDVTSVGNATSIAAGVIVNADINASAAIVDTKLDTIATALKVSNSATTAASANTASAIVARDASGNFSAGTVSAALTGNASTATALATGRTISITGDLAYTSPSFDGTGNVTAAGTLASVASAGTSGGSTAIPVVTINAKGLTTSITTAAVIAPAGTLTGSTLASGVTASSLTSLGTIASLAVTAGTISTTPSASTDIANKLYVDTVAQGLDAKASCIAATTANITLSGTQTIDGISVIAADRVLVKNQTLSQNNGIYLCASGAWTRTTDADTWDELTSAFVFIETGTVNADTGWVCTANAGGTLGTTALPWSQFSGAGSYTASTGLTLTGTVFSLTAPVTVALGGTNATSAGIASFNNITGYTASGATGTTSTNLVFSTSPTITSPTITGGALNGTLGATTPSTVAGTTGTFSGNVGLTNGKLTIASAGNDYGVDLSGSSANLTSVSFVNSNAPSIRWNWGVQGGTYATAGTMSLNLNGVGDAITVNGSTRSVSLSGGLNSTAIGATTPSTGAFSTLSATGQINGSSTGAVQVFSGTSTAAKYIDFQNGTNSLLLGRDNSTGATLGTGFAYESVIMAPSGVGITLGVNFAPIARITSTGAAITGTLSATGNVTSTTGVFQSVTGTGVRLSAPNNTSATIGVDGGNQLVVAGYAPVTISTGLAVTGTLSATGNVGIGTAASFANLTVGVVNGTSSLGTGIFRIQLDGNNGNVLGFGNGQYTSSTPKYNTNITNVFSTTAASNTTTFNISSGLDTVASNVLVLNGSGNVGIGTASPAFKLDVMGQAKCSYLFAGYTGNDGRVYLRNTSEVTKIYMDGSGNGVVSIGNDTGTAQLTLSLDSATKPSTNTWTIASDSRVKNVTGEYKKGLAEILALRPITYRYNGKAGFEDTTTENVSIIAQEAINHFPECVGTYLAKLNPEDAEKTELLNWNGHAVTFALINAIKELTARLAALESK